MARPAVADYPARWGYLGVDPVRYERRRYGGLVRRMNHVLLERALGRALEGVDAGALVLDMPCGTGIISRLLARRGFRVVGVDVSPVMLSVAHGRRDVIACVRAEAEWPPLRDRSVDAVVCTRFLMLVPAGARPDVLARLAAPARGPVIATVCHPYTWKAFGRRVRRAFGSRRKRSTRVDRRTLAADAAAAGLVLERIIPVMPIASEVWVVVMSRAVAT